MPLQFAGHPQRASVLDELHARPFASLATPARLLHFAFATGSEEAAADRRALTHLCAAEGRPGPAVDARHFRLERPYVSLRWESHSEFTTHTWEFLRSEVGIHPFEPPPDHFAAHVRQLPQPGPLLVAVDLSCQPAPGTAKDFKAAFGSERLAVSEVDGGAALVATDFAPDAGGFVRVLVANRRLSPGQTGALVQRVLEIETYRTFALLGLFEAQSLSPMIRRIEVDLPRMLEEMQGSDDLEGNHRLLDHLTGMAAELEAGAAGSLYRFGATRAYDEIVNLRLQTIQERPVTGYTSWSEFLSRRLSPAMRTCASTEERQANLSRKLARAAQLLRTRVDVALEQQNRSLLEAMNERARTQLRLQQTVEGLSVAAITYYVASLAHILFEGAHAAGLHIEPAAATAVIVPVALAAVAWTVRRIRRGHSTD
jgi:uncharacterized membrane-anchored protein